VLGWIIAACVILGIAGTLFGIARSWRKDTRTGALGIPDDALVASFVGGVKWSGGNATVPLARLDVHRWGIRITGSWGPLRRILPEWELLAADVGHAHLGKSRLGGTGICFVLNGSELLFWTSNTASVSAALAEVGIEVDQTPRQVPFTYP
jgi:hypothetical protein